MLIPNLSISAWNWSRLLHSGHLKWWMPENVACRWHYANTHTHTHNLLLKPHSHSTQAVQCGMIRYCLLYLLLIIYLRHIQSTADYIMLAPASFHVLWWTRICFPGLSDTYMCHSDFTKWSSSAVHCTCILLIRSYDDDDDKWNDDVNSCSYCCCCCCFNSCRCSSCTHHVRTCY